MTIGSAGPSKTSLARQLTRTALAVDLDRFDSDVLAKAKNCLLDFLSCAFEARHHPWSAQAIGIARALELLVETCDALSDSSAIPAHCRLEPMNQRLQPAS